MNIEDLRDFCLSLPGATEDIKWENNLAFMVGGKLFCLADLDPPLRASFKVPEEDFDGMTSTAGIVQAPYFARRKWILVTGEAVLVKREWERLLVQSYKMVKEGLPKKVRDSIPDQP